MTFQVPRAPPSSTLHIPLPVSSAPSLLTTTHNQDDNRVAAPKQLLHDLHAPSLTNHKLPDRLPIPTPLLLPALLHPPAHRLHPLLPVNILVQPYPNLLSSQSHLLPLADRRAQHTLIPQLHSTPAPQPARLQSHLDMDVYARRRESRRIHFRWR
jgi:hypothetical protein